MKYTVFTNYFVCKKIENAMKIKDPLPTETQVKKEASTLNSGNCYSTDFCKELC